MDCPTPAVVAALNEATRSKSKPQRAGRSLPLPPGVSPPAAQAVCGEPRFPPPGQAWPRPVFAAADPGAAGKSSRSKAALMAWPIASG